MLMRSWPSATGLPTPVLSNFVDGLDDSPPTISFESSEAGTGYWDFHSSATPPAIGRGDIASGTFRVFPGANAPKISFLGLANETGYLHIHVVLSTTSNALTSQEITVPDIETVAVDLGDLTAFTSRIDCTTPDATTITATDQAGFQTPFVRESISISAPGDYTLIFDVGSIGGVDNIYTALREFDTTPSPLFAVFDCANGNVASISSGVTARITAKGGGGYICEVDFSVTSDGSGVFDLGLSERDDTILRVTDPTTDVTAQVSNGRIIVRA